MSYKIDIEERVLHFKQPAGTSRGVYTERRIWLLRVSDGSAVGTGECAPLPQLSCDALPNYADVLRHFCDDVERTGEIPYEALRDYPSMLFGLETALLDLRNHPSPNTHHPSPLPQQPSISVGSTVRIKGLQSVGTVESIEGKTAAVIFGGMRTKMRLERLELADDSKPTEKHASLSAYNISRETRETIDTHRQNFHQDLDVRGMRGDEALNAVTYFIDDAILVGMSRVRILHGKGNGILRQLIRQYLSTVPNVTHFADEHVQFGGAGITVVDL